MHTAADHSENFTRQFEYCSADRSISYNGIMVVVFSTARTQTSTWIWLDWTVRSGYCCMVTWRKSFMNNRVDAFSRYVRLRYKKVLPLLFSFNYRATMAKRSGDSTLWKKPAICFGLVTEWASAPEWTMWNREKLPALSRKLTILWAFDSVMCVYVGLFLCNPSISHRKHDSTPTDTHTHKHINK